MEARNFNLYIMNVLSLFDGMSCGQIALIESGYKINKYYSSEIDKFAIAQTQHNFQNTIQLGSVTDVRAKNLDKIDLLIGGSPCQGFSFAGKQLNFDDPRSALFFEFVRIWKEVKAINPNAKFLLENVNMKKEHLRVISEYLGVFPVRINSNLVSAQNRDRWYWSNIKNKDVGLFSELWTDIPQPEDRGIFLKDILQPESEVDEKYYMKNKVFLRRIKQAEANHVFGVLKHNGNFKISNDKANCIDANYSKGIDNHSQRTAICVAMRGRNPDNPSDRRIGSPTEQRLEPRTDGKTNCLTSVVKDNLILQYPSSMVEPSGSIMDLYKLRRLTPKECSRLQTIPDWYEWVVSDTQIYKMLGNGWTIEVIKHIFSFLEGFNNT